MQTSLSVAALSKPLQFQKTLFENEYRAARSANPSNAGIEPGEDGSRVSVRAVVQLPKHWMRARAVLAAEQFVAGAQF